MKREINRETMVESQRAARLPGAGHDVIVVGARVAGAATAMLLARRGLKVLLLERAPAPGFDTLSTQALMRAGVLQLHRWGLLHRVVDAETPAVRSTVLHYGEDAQVVHLKERTGMSVLYGPRRTILDPWWKPRRKRGPISASAPR